MRILCAVLVMSGVFLSSSPAIADSNSSKFLFLSESKLNGKVRNTQQFVITRDGTLCIKRTIIPGKDPSQTKYDYLSPHWSNSACVQLLELKNTKKQTGKFKSELNSPRSEVNGKTENDRNSLELNVTKRRFEETDGSIEIETHLSVSMTVLDKNYEQWLKGDIDVSISLKRDRDGNWSVYTTNGKRFDTIVTTIRLLSAAFSIYTRSTTSTDPIELSVKDPEFEYRRYSF